jgi:hypothetical protein
MAFTIANLAPVGNTSKPLSGVGTATLKGAPTIWAYATADALATVNTAGYFNDASDLLKTGDLIIALTGAGSGGTLAQGLCTVVSNAAGVVDVADGTAIAQTDSD